MNIDKSLELIDKLFEETPQDVLREIIDSINTTIRHDVSFEGYIQILMNQFTDAFSKNDNVQLDSICEQISVMDPWHISIDAEENYYCNHVTCLAA